MKKNIRIATRESELALWQANFIKQSLLANDPDLTIELIGMTTKGDQILDQSLAKIGGKGLFVKELERALLDNTADIAVHSMKDVPNEFPDDLGITVITERHDARDAFVSVNHTHFNNLPSGAVVGTSSLRRQCQLQALRNDLQFVSLRGNVNTRLRKLEEGQMDAIILAAAGLERLHLTTHLQHYLEPSDVIPAAGQGALGIECRLADHALQSKLAFLVHPSTQACVLAERAVVKRLDGSCQVPIGAYGYQEGESVFLRACVGSIEKQTLLHAEAKGSASHPEELGLSVADDLLQQGARELLL